MRVAEKININWWPLDYAAVDYGAPGPTNLELTVYKTVLNHNFTNVEVIDMSVAGGLTRARYRVPTKLNQFNRDVQFELNLILQPHKHIALFSCQTNDEGGYFWDR